MELVELDTLRQFSSSRDKVVLYQDFLKSLFEHETVVCDALKNMQYHTSIKTLESLVHSCNWTVCIFVNCFENKTILT